MPNKDFLEKYSLYKKLPTNTHYPHNVLVAGTLEKPAIHMECLVCKTDQTFNMENEYYPMGGRQDESMFGKVVDIRYRCSACKHGLRVFTVYFGHSPVDKDGRSELILEKVGQSPAWSIDIDQKVQKSLGEDLTTYYRRGLVCESQGYGIGAFAYYRRIVEIKIDNLLEDISILIPQEETEKYQAALAEVKKEQQASKKIELVKELLPSSLRPDGINPLDILHSMLSEGLHAEPDEDCLEYAEEIRECLVYLLNEVTQKRASAAQFTDRMKKFLDKRSAKP